MVTPRLTPNPQRMPEYRPRIADIRTTVKKSGPGTARPPTHINESFNNDKNNTLPTYLSIITKSNILFSLHI
ncbi:hypothetical protein WSS15_30250 [Acetobacter pasteurianus]|nr:hypothetical protein WSS15_30250 [Acetobacter pasteurianus]